MTLDSILEKHQCDRLLGAEEGQQSNVLNLLATTLPSKRGQSPPHTLYENKYGYVVNRPLVHLGPALSSISERDIPSMFDLLSTIPVWLVVRPWVAIWKTDLECVCPSPKFLES